MLKTWLGLLMVFSFFAGVGGAVMVAFFALLMPEHEASIRSLSVTIVASGVSVSILLGFVNFVWGKAEHARLKRKLASRSSLSAAEFAQAYFGESGLRAELAAELRNALEKSMKLPLDGLRPDDRFQEDLQTNVAAFPELFWPFEEKYGVTIYPTEGGYARVKETFCHVKTFRDLIDFVEEKAGSRPPNESA